ncbi:MAG TPA: glycosyltransferase family 39 protein [Blastocatellia bacterium]|nr:glycosyltransferase family 39 protein [Blastocatellia bacterium]
MTITRIFTQNRFLRNNFDLLILALIIGGFVFVAGQRLATLPLPETDEAYILQIPYEILNRGQLSWPMYRYLGGNIENVWHTFFPLFFLILSGFFKLFGWGLAQGRAFMLISASLVLVMTHLIGRRLFNWRVGLIAVLLLVGDQVFFERSRLLRYDFLAAFFAMLAYYLYEKAEENKRGGYYIASGLAAGAGVMCHTNVLYILAAIALLMLLRHGWRVIKEKKLYQFALSALVVMAYVIVYDIIDYQNVLLQNRGDKLHFAVLQPMGFWHNFLAEGERYVRWMRGGGMFLNVPRTTLRIFQALTVAAIIYLIIYTVARIRLGGWREKPAVRIFMVTLVTVLFHALIVSHKNIYYLSHLTPWFALCVGIMFNDGLSLIGRLRESRWPNALLLYRTATVAVALAVLAFALQVARQDRRYLREVNNPEFASFDELASVLRSVVPEGVCPVAMKSPIMWLAFPEYDRCFATIEKRMMKALDIDGNEYAVLAPHAYDKRRARDTRALDAKYPLIAELRETRYGLIRVYYTGTNPQYRMLKPKTYYFFGEWRGHITDEQVAQAREVWSTDAERLSACAGFARDDEGVIIDVRGGQSVELCSLDVKPGAIYQLLIAAPVKDAGWEIIVVDAKTGAAIYQNKLSDNAQQKTNLFRAINTDKIKLEIRRLGQGAAEPFRIARVSVLEVPTD